jgi:DNA-directed RNA polymerase specialized sigma24 family protein
MVSDDQLRDGFEAERPRLQRIAARILGEAHAAQDVVQQTWLQLHATDEPIDKLPGWLTTGADSGAITLFEALMERLSRLAEPRGCPYRSVAPDNPMSNEAMRSR